MAKKRRQKVEKKVEYDFKLPEFDEHEYIGLELRKAKASLISFVYALLMVVITFQLYTVTFPDARGPMILGIFGVVVLPILIKYVKIDTSDFDWKNWVGSGAVYMMSWLAIFILVCNPPFSDFIEPEIEKIQCTYQQSNNGTWDAWDKDPTIPTITAPIRINFSAKITDNTAIDKNSVTLKIEGPKDYERKMRHLSDDKYQIIFDNNGLTFEEGTYTYSIEAKDINGHKAVIDGNSFRIV